MVASLKLLLGHLIRQVGHIWVRETGRLVLLQTPGRFGSAVLICLLSLISAMGPDMKVKGGTEKAKMRK